MPQGSLLETLKLIRSDYRAQVNFLRQNPQWAWGVSPGRCPGFLALALFRIGRCFYLKGLKFPARLLFLLNVILTKCELAHKSEIGEGAVLLHPTGHIISSAIIGKNVVMAGFSGMGGGGGHKDIGAGKGQPIVGDGVLFHVAAFLQGAYRLGDGSVIDVKCYVHKDVAPGEVVPVRRDDFWRKRTGKARSIIDAAQGEL